MWVEKILLEIIKELVYHTNYIAFLNMHSIIFSRIITNFSWYILLNFHPYFSAFRHEKQWPSSNMP